MNELVLRYLGAHYVSDVWFDNWRTSGSLHDKARAVVVFDRCLNSEYVEPDTGIRRTLDYLCENP